ncbi:MAG: O-antigen ligase family protein [Candidatus Saccharimonadales bacterium]
MKSSTTVGKLALVLSWLGALIIVILPFHAFLTVWLASAIDHYTLLRLWKEFLLIIIVAGALYLLATDDSLRRRMLSSRLTQAVEIYFLISIAWGIAAYALEEATLKALGYGLIVNLRFLIFFLAIWIIATKSQWLKKQWPKLLLIPAAIVIFIGLLQRFVLPYDVLKYFGYSSETIFPYQTINRDINYPRIMSTLRGANPLGAYLVLVLSASAIFFLKFTRRRLAWGLFGFAALAALLFSYSRGAWIGMALGAVFLGWISLKKIRTRNLALAGLILLLIVGAASTLALRNNATFQNYFFHTNDRSTVDESSNEEHISAFRNGLDDVLGEPLGRGIGTAGPASVYNENRVRIADNYFIQIAQEVGWLGLVVFLAINFLAARELWFRRSDALPGILLISFVGLTAANLVSHAWTDDTLAYIWWGLAGVCLSNNLKSRVSKNNS